MRRKAEGIIFEFAGNSGSDMTTPQRGRLHCDFCEDWYKSPHIEVCINGFTVCPSCIQAGPAALAAKARRIAGDKDWVARVYGPMDQESLVCMIHGYRRLASVIRGFRSFENLSGGKVALGVAAVLQAPAGRRKRKAA
jgi:hypothetical protein